MTSQLCTTDDDYVRDNMRWTVKLSDGLNVYEDDGRPGMAEPSAWKRLKSYCERNGVYIVEMWLQFRSNRVQIGPTNAEGYYLVKSVFAVWGENRTHHAYIVGPLINGRIHVTHWQTPELVKIDEEIRDPDFSSPSLIYRKGLTGG